MQETDFWIIGFLAVVAIVIAALWLRSDRVARKVRGAVERNERWVSGQLPMHDRNFYVVVHVTSFVIVAVSYAFMLLPWIGPAFWVLATSLSAYGVSFAFGIVERWYDRAMRRTRGFKGGDLPAVPWIPNAKVFHKRYQAANPIEGTVTDLKDQAFVSSSTGDSEHWPFTTGHRTHWLYVSPKMPELGGIDPKLISGARTVSGVWRGSEHYAPAKFRVYLLGSEEWAAKTEDPAIKRILLALDPDVRGHIRNEYPWTKPTTLVAMAHDLLSKWEKEISGPRPTLANVEADLEDARRQLDYYKSEYEEALNLGKLSRSARREA